MTVLVANTVKALPVDATTGLASGYGRGNLSEHLRRRLLQLDGQGRRRGPGGVGELRATPAAPACSTRSRTPPAASLTYFYTKLALQRAGPVQPDHVAVHRHLPGGGLAYYGYTGEYRFRVTEAPPTLQLVTSYDDSVSSSPNTPTLTNTSPGNLTATVAGYIGQGDGNGDFFSLGNVLAGTQLNLTLSQPANSLLGGVLNIYNAAGMNVTNNITAGNTLSYTVPAGAGGAYYARVSSASTTTVSFWMNWNGTNSEIPIGFGG